jgi:hypothetical protein
MRPDWRGVTSCDYASGKTWSAIRNTGCDTPCTEKHEAQHRHDMSSCCARVKRCIQRYGPAGISLCTAAYRKWAYANMDWFECRAYTVSAKCLGIMFLKRNCLCIPFGADPCCDRLGMIWPHDAAEVVTHCAGIPKPWGRPPTPCPFSWTGKLPPSPPGGGNPPGGGPPHTPPGPPPSVAPPTFPPGQCCGWIGNPPRWVCQCQ